MRDTAHIFEISLNDLHVKYKKDVLLKNYTSFKIGGPADFMVFPNDLQEIEKILKVCKEENFPFYVLGKGSNLLVPDEGYRGAVIYTGQMQKVLLENENTIYCESGASLASVCQFAMRCGLSGLEFAYGIPGSIGGAVYMNAGAYGGEMAEVVFKAVHVTRDAKVVERFFQKQNFSYRKSIYTDTDNCIFSVLLKLVPKDASVIEEKMKTYYQKRRASQPLQFPNAGSTFKRPGERLYAAALIEKCNLKGKRFGDAQVSEKHSGFIVNLGNATCKEVEMLIEDVRETVFRQTGIKLETEIRKMK